MTDTFPRELRQALAETSAPLLEGADALPYLDDRSGAAGAAGARALAVVRPGDAAEVATVLKLAHRHRVPVVTRGAGTGLSGGATAVDGCLVLSTERLNRVVEISPEDEVVIVQPGVINADLNAALEGHGLYYAPDPASHAISTIGGNIATNAGGLRSAKYGVTRDSVLALDVVLADGTALHTGHRSVKGVTGLDLTALFVGSEGTLGVIVGATLRLRPLPAATATVSAYYPSVRAALDGVRRISRTGVVPAIAELIDHPSLRNIDENTGSRLTDGGHVLLLVRTDGHAAAAEAEDVVTALRHTGGDAHRVTDEAEAERLWELRRSGRGRTRPLWTVGEDVAVPTSQVARMYEEGERIGRRHGLDFASVAHAADGNLHPVLSRPVPEGVAPTAPAPPELDAAADELVRAALALGGTVTGEHGVGVTKRRWLEDELGAAGLALQRAIKAVFDPLGILNPGKAI
ncbi:FAD-binding oxidoreductase [Streptomyces antioxidans]|uniref:FAD-binding oxidoreductase n=1 Tax=Streptomyces antioxidans TaxID=1507734 RepID=A0A1V4D7G9_9ACTN|nr:FAD-linked oxidase C-terminal domain-containing protein [Streptomyces antioxidans]OPF81009.1 FAD-binding oxidoreductase [Streptomyces antioxidans]